MGLIISSCLSWGSELRHLHSVKPIFSSFLFCFSFTFSPPTPKHPTRETLSIHDDKARGKIIMPNWELNGCCNHDQIMFMVTIGVFTIVIFAVEGMQVHANEGGVTITRGGIYWLILPAGYLGSSFWGLVLILAATNKITAELASACFIVASFITLFIAKNWTLRGLCIGFILFFVAMWLLQEYTKIRIIRYVILFIDIYDDLISRRVNSSDAEKFAELCPCCNGVGWGVVWGMISFAFLCGAMYLGLVILS